MEFPLFPVLLHAAVKTPPVPWGWAGLGKSACLPIIHLAALERESRSLHMACCASLCGEKSDKVCLFSTSSLVSLRQEQIHTGIFTHGRSTKYHQECLRCFSVSWTLQWSGTPVWMTAHRRPVFCMHLYVPIHLSVCTFGFTPAYLFQASVIVITYLTLSHRYED